MKKKKKMTLVKGAAIIGGVMGAMTYLTQSGVGDQAVVDKAFAGDIKGVYMELSNPNRLNVTRQTKAAFNSAIITAAPPAGVYLGKAVVKAVKDLI